MSMMKFIKYKILSGVCGFVCIVSVFLVIV